MKPQRRLDTGGPLPPIGHSPGQDSIDGANDSLEAAWAALLDWGRAVANTYGITDEDIVAAIAEARRPNANRA